MWMYAIVYVFIEKANPHVSLHVNSISPKHVTHYMLVKLAFIHFDPA